MEQKYVVLQFLLDLGHGVTFWGKYSIYNHDVCTRKNVSESFLEIVSFIEIIHLCHTSCSVNKVIYHL